MKKCFHKRTLNLPRHLILVTRQTQQLESSQFLYLSDTPQSEKLRRQASWDAVPICYYNTVKLCRGVNTEMCWLLRRAADRGVTCCCCDCVVAARANNVKACLHWGLLSNDHWQHSEVPTPSESPPLPLPQYVAVAACFYLFSGPSVTVWIWEGRPLDWLVWNSGTACFWLVSSLVGWGLHVSLRQTSGAIYFRYHVWLVPRVGSRNGRAGSKFTFAVDS